MQNNSDLFPTEDFTTAVFLRVAGFNLVKLERNNRVTTFYFEKVNPDNLELDIEKASEEYWNRTMKAPVRDVLEAEKELKTRLHNIPR